MNKDHSDTTFEVGDWVWADRAGVWQVYRVLEYKCVDPHVDGQLQANTTIFVKRFINKKQKRSFTERTCHPCWVKKIDSDAQVELTKFISQNKKIHEAFLKYEPREFSLVYNARIGLPTAERSARIASALSKLGAITALEIDAQLTSMGIDTIASPAWTAQFESRNYQLRDGCIVYEFSRILEF